METSNVNDSKNSKHSDQKDQSVDVQDFDGSRATAKKKPKVLAWCQKCYGKGKKKLKKKKEKKKKKKKNEEKKPGTKKSIFKKIKESRCWGRKKKKKKTKDGVEMNEDEERDEHRRASTSTRNGREHVIIDKSNSRISVDEGKGSREERRKEKRRRMEKAVSYVDSRPIIDKSNASLPVRDFTKSCCYLCAENSLAIAAAMGPLKLVGSDKSMETDEPKLLEKSCSPIKCTIRVRTVKSMVRIKVRDTCTSYANVIDQPKVPKPKKKKKFKIFPKTKRAECPVRRTVGCVTETSTKPAEPKKPKEKKTFEPCCRDKAV